MQNLFILLILLTYIIICCYESPRP